MRLICISLFLLSLAGLAQTAQPNFMFILADDCTFRDLEIYGGQAKTPNLNTLASEGMKFNRCYQAASMCSPTRHNLYTGIYPIHSGAYPNHTFVNQGTLSIAHHLKASGYRVALVGKTHINPKSSFPFEYLQGMEYGYSDNEKTPNEDTVIRNPLLKKFIEECTQAGTPFCVFAASYDPHGPYTRGDKSMYDKDKLVLPPNIFDTPSQRENYRDYMAECTFFDNQVGECLSYLDEYKVKKSTLVMVATEQGSSFPFGKWNNYEHSLSSGLIVRWPGKIKEASESEAIVEYCDVVSTLIEAAGTKALAPVDGKSFLPILLGAKSTHKTFACGSQSFVGVNGNKEPYGMRTIVGERYRYIKNLHPSAPITYSQTSAFLPKLNPNREDWRGEIVQMSLDGNIEATKYINRMTHRPAEELYDVKNDPHCLVNLIARKELQAIKKDLNSKLNTWMREQGDEAWETELKAIERTTKTSKLWQKIKKEEVRK